MTNAHFEAPKQEHPFAPFVRILGEVEAIQVGTFLMLLPELDLYTASQKAATLWHERNMKRLD